jgi:hypothetical protein
VFGAERQSPELVAFRRREQMQRNTKFLTGVFVAKSHSVVSS